MPIEKKTHELLVKELGDGAGEERYGLYTTTRKHVVEDILPNISRVIPSITDHGPGHVASVLANAGELLSINTEPSKLNHIELYCLILSILFHDVGNIFGRAGHQRKVSRIYDYCRAEAAIDNREKNIVIKVCEAHCGEAPDGTNDTLKHITEFEFLARSPIRLCTIAALLRFSDELEEGSKRTSRFMQKYCGYPPSGSIHHKYADISQIAIDRGNDRIALTYNISIAVARNGALSNRTERMLKELLEYTYKRIIKLDQERKYAKHYCDLLSNFKMTTVKFNFWIRGEVHTLGLPQLTITDLVVPGDDGKSIYDYSNDYGIPNVITQIKSLISGGTI